MGSTVHNPRGLEPLVMQLFQWSARPFDVQLSFLLGSEDTSGLADVRSAYRCPPYGCWVLARVLLCNEDLSAPKSRIAVR